ncbi:MAG: hypothetical protein ACO2PO_15795, partial [Candidatus Calescibacterium sp.]
LIVFGIWILPKNVSPHTVNCCNGSFWLQLEPGFWSWVNTQCSNIFNDTIMRNFIRCLLQKTTDSSGGQCRCKEPPGDCTISSYTPRNLVSTPVNIPVPGKGTIQIKEAYIISWSFTSLSCSVSVVDDAATSCPGTYPSYDYVKVNINLGIQATVRLVVNQRAAGGEEKDNYYGEINISAVPAELGFNFFLRHVENFLTPSLASCNGSTLQDIGLSVAYLYLGNPATLRFRWTSLPPKTFLAQLVGFIEAQLRYMSFNRDIAAGVKWYLGPMSVYDLKDWLGTDLINNPAETRGCRNSGKFSHPITGTVYYDVGIETGFCYNGGGTLHEGSLDIDIDYELPEGDPGTMGCYCPAVLGGSNPCGGSHICAAIHCSFFQRLWCLLINEKVLHIEDPPGSGVPVSKNTDGIGRLMGPFGTCEQWAMFLPHIRSFCPSGSEKLMGIKAVPRTCGSVVCGTTMQRPGALGLGAWENYPVDLKFSVPYDFELWINDDGWKRLMSLLIDLDFGVNLAYWLCSTVVGSPCEGYHRVAYLGVVIDPDITGVETDSTHPIFPGLGGWTGVLADVIGVLLNGNIFGAAYLGFGLRPIIDPNEVIPFPPGPPNLDPVPAATYTPGSFEEPNLDSSIDVSGGFLRLRFNISGGLTGQWLARMIDENTDLAPPLNAKKAILPETLIVNYTEPKWTGMEIQVDAVGGEDIMYVWRIDGGVWRGPERTNKIVLPGLLEGYHKFEVAAVDNKTGLYDPTPAKLEFLVDSLGPDIYTNLQQDKVRSGFVVKVKAVDSWTPADKIQISWRIDDGDWTDWTYEKEIKLDLPEGQHKIEIKARDLKGNESIWSKSFFVQKEVIFGCLAR